MARILVVLAALGAMVAAAAAVWPAGSQAAPATPTQRTFVSTSGSDLNTCTRAEPCRNFAAALPNTLAGGEVVALDSGGYGSFTIDKAVTVVGAPGAHVAVTAFTGDAIVVNAGTSDTVVLRNLHLTGLGASRGIFFQAGGTLQLESLAVGGFVGQALHAAAEAANLIVTDSSFQSSGDGVYIDGSLRVEIERTRADRNGSVGFTFLNGATGSVRNSQSTRNASHGFIASSGAVLAITDSVADGNVGTGIAVLTTGTQVNVTGAVLSNNQGAGMFTSGTPPVARISGSTVTGNGVGLEESTGALETYGDNLIRGNTTNVIGTLNPVAKG